VIDGGSLALFHARTLLEHGLLGLAILDLASANAFTQLKCNAQRGPKRMHLGGASQCHSVVQIQRAGCYTVGKLGCVHILFCFAGVVGCTHAIDIALEEWGRTLGINTSDAFIYAQAVAKLVLILQTLRPLGRPRARSAIRYETMY